MRRALVFLAVLWLAFLSTAARSTPAPSTDDTITIHETSGKEQDNRPVAVSRPFRQGEILNFVRASIGSTSLLTQTDVKNRWPDGSVKFAVVSFVIPKLPANRSVMVSFSNQASGNNTDPLSQNDMLDPVYDFDVRIEMNGRGGKSEVVSGRTMLQGGAFRYWLRGPVVTAVVVEDRSPQRMHDKDFGDGSKALHPIFEAWFYPANKQVDIGVTLENTWVSSTAAKGTRDLTYEFALKAGWREQALRFKQPTFTHIGLTRWHRRLWLGADPESLRVDHNLRYLVSTRTIPNYDTNLAVAKSLISAAAEGWQRADKSLAGTQERIGNYEKALSAGGTHPWVGLANTWDILYLLSMDKRLLQMSLGNADLAGRFPWHMREADTRAGSGGFFDMPLKGVVDTFGRVVSINARRTVATSDLTGDPAQCGGYAADKIQTGTVSDGGMDFYNRGRHHIPDVAYIPYLVSGRYYYMEELQFEAAYILGYKNGCYGESWERHGEDGYFNDGETRGNAWAYRTTAYAAFISLDGSPEKAYFEDKLLNNIAKDEGSHNLPCDVPGKQAHCDWGRKNQLGVNGASPLGIWDQGNAGLVDPPVKTDGSVASATSPWMENFVIVALGVARDFGYPTDSLLRFTSKRLFNQLLNPKTSPYLVEAYRMATILSATRDWIRDWSEVNKYHNVPSGWSTGRDVDNGYGFVALGAVSFLYPYNVDGYSGQQAWNYLKANKPEQNRFATESPKFDILPRMDKPVVPTARFEPSHAGDSNPVITNHQTRNGSRTLSVGDNFILTPAAQSSSAGTPSTLGWFAIPNSTLKSVCPNAPAIQATTGCESVILAWSGGIADTKRNRLVIWGGGHNNYWGNEVYALDLNSLATLRLNNPSPVDNVLSCPESYVDGTPSSRHTYGGLAYITHADRMFAYGGSKSSCGYFSTGTWTLDLATMQWQQMNPTGTLPKGGPGQIADYDPKTRQVFLHDYVSGLYAYNYDKNTWTRVLEDIYGIDYHMMGVIDPKRRLFILIGAAGGKNGGIQVFNIDGKGSRARQSWSITGCSNLLNSQSPGLAYDAKQDRIVGWPNFGNTVYIFNPDTRSCTTQTIAGGPPDSNHNGAPSTTLGTFGRFRYFPDKGVFVLANDAHTNAYILRLTLAAEGGSKTAVDRPLVPSGDGIAPMSSTAHRSAYPLR
jgi:hypothetical protein